MYRSYRFAVAKNVEADHIDLASRVTKNAVMRLVTRLKGFLRMRPSNASWRKGLYRQLRGPIDENLWAELSRPTMEWGNVRPLP